jgi:hypothetical protein
MKPIFAPNGTGDVCGLVTVTGSFLTLSPHLLFFNLLHTLDVTLPKFKRCGRL